MRNKQELLHEYYPQDILYRRAKLVKIIQKARTVHEYKFKCKLVNDKLMVKDKEFTAASRAISMISK